METKIKIVIICILLSIICFCLYQTIPYLYNLQESKTEYSDLTENVVEESTEETEEEYDWQSVTIDFDYLQSVNSDVVAWIRFDPTGTISIDYPVMYNADNDVKYLHANWKGEYSYAGSIFLESLNSPDFSDAQTILYGHNMRNGTMFGTLKKYRYSDSAYNNENNRYYTIYTPEAAYRYQIFSYFTTDSSSYIYTVGFTLGFDSYAKQIEKINATSTTGITASADDQITVLSTCVSGNDTDERFVVVGKLVDTCRY